MAMEGLHITFNTTVKARPVKGVIGALVGNPVISVSHFSYVDDAVLVLEWC